MRKRKTGENKTKEKQKTIKHMAIGHSCFQKEAKRTKQDESQAGFSKFPSLGDENFIPKDGERDHRNNKKDQTKTRKPINK